MYKFHVAPDAVVRLADGAIIPFDDENTDYREYLEFVEGGGVTDPADVPPPLTLEQQKIIAAEYLRNTDFWVTINASHGAIIPLDVVAQREAAIALLTAP